MSNFIYFNMEFTKVKRKFVADVNQQFLKAFVMK